MNIPGWYKGAIYSLNIRKEYKHLKMNKYLRMNIKKKKKNVHPETTIPDTEGATHRNWPRGEQIQILQYFT